MPKCCTPLGDFWRSSAGLKQGLTKGHNTGCVSVSAPVSSCVTRRLKITISPAALMSRLGKPPISLPTGKQTDSSVQISLSDTNGIWWGSLQIEHARSSDLRRAHTSIPKSYEGFRESQRFRMNRNKMCARGSDDMTTCCIS